MRTRKWKKISKKMFFDAWAMPVLLKKKRRKT